MVICGGGGAAPVTEDADGRLAGVQTLVDKDYVATLLAIALHADRLLILTDIAAVMRDFGAARARPLSQLDLDNLSAMHFPAGSMAPKIEACRRFVAAIGQSAAIGSMSEVEVALGGVAGTTITEHASPASAVGAASPSSRRFDGDKSGPSTLLATSTSRDPAEGWSCRG